MEITHSADGEPIRLRVANDRLREGGFEARVYAPWGLGEYLFVFEFLYNL